MMNSSSLSKALWLTIIVATLSVVALLLAFFDPKFVRFAVVLTISFSTIAVLYLRQVQALVGRVSEVAKQCAHGDMESRIIVDGEEGDLRQLANHINAMIDNADAYVHESQTALEHAAQEKYYRTIMLTGMQGCWKKGAQTINDSLHTIHHTITGDVRKAAKQLETTVIKAIDELAQSTGQLQATSRNLSGIAENGRLQAQSLANASDETSQAVSTVAAAVEEFSASIGDINKQITMSSMIAREAVSSTSRANDALSELMVSAEKIGNIVELINAIASQINLLALNATIEAARAGDAGKGFAVVASEVKNLATQTAKATAEIAESIGTTREGIRKAVVSVQGIGKVVNKIDEATTTIAAAMEEQSAVTQDISNSIQSVARNTNDIFASVGDLSEAAAKTGAASHEMGQSLDMVSAQSSLLRKEIDRFVSSLKA